MMSNNQTEYTKERKKEERREQRKRKEQRKVQEEHPDYSRSKKQREKNQLAVEEWYLNQIPSIVDFDIELTPSKIEELREYGNMILAGYDFTPKSLRETLLVYQTGKDILHDMYIFREAYRKGRTLQEYKQRLQDYKHGTLAFDIDHEYMLHDKEPVLKSLPLDFGKNFENNIHRECEEESEDSEDEEASSEKANEEGSDSSDEAPSDTETE
jgi:tRNA splicing endonuclease